MKEFGVYREDQRIASRSYFIIDKEGIVRYKHVPTSGNAKFLLSTETLLNEVKKINGMK
jgi:alkyl hydroperoxide reductase subunit AhpC